MAIYGGIIGGLIGLIIYSLVKNQSILKITDLVTPSLIIAQAIGRWGNFANQEVYGKIVTEQAQQWFPFAVYIDKLGEWHYAMFFYESMMCLVGFLILMYLFKRVKQCGVVTSVYLIFYGTERFILEGMRQESEILFIGNTNIPVSQVVSLLFVIAGLITLITILYLERRKIKLSLNQVNKKDENIINEESNFSIETSVDNINTKDEINEKINKSDDLNLGSDEDKNEKNSDL